MVDNVATLSGVQKMYYLRNSLEGEAEKLIRSYKCTEADYNAAWNALKERYNNKRLIVNAHMDQLFSISKLDIESASATRSQLDTFTESVRALSALNMPTEHWDVFLVHFLQSRLDSSTKRAWEMSLESSDLPTFDQLHAFIERRCRAMENNKKPSSSTSTNLRHHSTYRQQSASSNSKPQQALVTNSTFSSCAGCKGKHNISSCPEFLRLYPGLRFQKATELRLCYNCLRPDHSTVSCNSALSCRTCSRRHHSLLHYERQPNPRSSSPIPTHLSIDCEKDVLLATALVKTFDSSGKIQHIRILMDTGATRSFNTEHCVKMLGLQRAKANTSVSGISAVSVGRTQGAVEITIQPIDHQQEFYMQALILQKITNQLPSTPINLSQI